LQAPEEAEVETFRYVYITHVPLEVTHVFRFPETEKISPPLLQMSEVTFGYTKNQLILKSVNFDVGLDSRLAIVGANGVGKSTL
jgi:ATPase subunit of ABC transporter with duplicated ATPase domains